MFDYKKAQSGKLAAIAPLGIGRFFSLPDDVISLGLGEPDFSTPVKASAGAIEAIQQGLTHYPPSEGLPQLRVATAEYLAKRFGLDYHAEEVLITVGGSEAFDSSIRAFIENGDEVIVPEPTFSCYEPIIELVGGKVVPIITTMEDGFRLTAEKLKAAITPRTKILLLNYPNNPTGIDMSHEDYAAIAAVLRDTNIIVLTDEIYSELSYTDTHACILEQPGMRERTLYLSGFSKAYAMTGWRLGYVCGPTYLLEPIHKVHQYAVMCASGVAQYAALAGLKNCDQEVIDMVAAYRERRDFVYRRICEMGLPCVKPEGAFYLFPCIRETGFTSDQFCDKLVEEGRVAMIPGTAFGEAGEGFVRISYAYDMATLNEAMNRLEEFVTRYINQPQAVSF
ncbi:MAG: pyridoxal phosphate-dependent aminotransferase [Clostridiales bacterium]